MGRASEGRVPEVGKDRTRTVRLIEPTRRPVDSGVPEAYVPPRVRVRRSEVRYVRCLKHQVGDSNQRLGDAARGKSLHCIADESDKKLRRELARQKRGLGRFSHVTPLIEPYYRPDAELSPKEQRTDATPGRSLKSSHEFVEKMAAMQVQASEWCREDLRAKVASCPDLREASVGIRERQGEERQGFHALYDSTMERFLNVSRHEGKETEARKAEEVKRGPKTEDGTIYVDKVERWHRSLLWSQQFRFFDRHIAKVLEADDAEHTVWDENRSVSGTLQVEKAARSRERVRQLRRLPSLPIMRPRAQTLYGWTTTHSPKPKPRAYSPLLLERTSSAPALEPRSPLSRQPSLLDTWGAAYYGEDVRISDTSTIEHEDVLHTVNPALFPLQRIPLRAPTPVTQGLLDGPIDFLDPPTPPSPALPSPTPSFDGFGDFGADGEEGLAGTCGSSAFGLLASGPEARAVGGMRDALP